MRVCSNPFVIAEFIVTPAEVPGSTVRPREPVKAWRGSLAKRWPPGAIRREKAIKRWKREYKLNLIERGNPERLDLAIELGFEPLHNDKPG
jgi:hypothetical protein